MTPLLRMAASAAMAAALAFGAGAPSHGAMAEAWVKVEFTFKLGGRTSNLLADIPVPQAEDVPQYCERDLFWAEKGLALSVQQGHPELADAEFVGLRCVTEGGKIKTATQPTDLLPRQQPLADLAGVKLFFADGNGKEVSRVYQERRDRMSSTDCQRRLSSLIARYRQMASQDEALGDMTFLRGECVVLKTFN